MTRDQAKHILSAYRGPVDEADPVFADALDLCRQDADLARWLEEQRQLDDKLRAALRAVPPPAGLRRRLLAIDPARPGRKIVPFLLRPQVLALAALFVVALALTPLWLDKFLPRNLDVASLEDFVSRLVSKGEITLAANDIPLADIRAWLGRQSAPSQFVVPSPLSPDTVLGCQKYAVRGEHVALVCFRADGQAILHMFVARLPAANRTLSAREVVTKRGVGMFAWTDEAHLYVLADVRGPDSLRRLVAGEHTQVSPASRAPLFVPRQRT